ncbi:MAG: nuclear transport factor 2 family protein [Rubrivivax sp.]|nr:nuclear transport factor 2 family protein [Rubrivivax sp.]
MAGTDPTPWRAQDARLAAVARFYERLHPGSVAGIENLYAAGARFKDPFNDVQGVAAIRRIFEHMFEQVHEPKFEIEAGACEGDTAFLRWTMSFARHGRPGRRLALRGCTELRFDATGRVGVHRDYWDAAEELYEKLPLLGALLRGLKRRLATPQR